MEVPVEWSANMRYEVEEDAAQQEIEADEGKEELKQEAWVQRRVGGSGRCKEEAGEREGGRAGRGGRGGGRGAWGLGHEKTVRRRRMENGEGRKVVEKENNGAGRRRYRRYSAKGSG